ncbi:MAG: hypothetical protein J6K15_06250 [Lachnospiraceae bacterium]|nr:hypothetical protein [Lachnospiraceae bacterium]
MTRKELCEMCTEYSTDTKCENRENCKLQEILTENTQLKEENKRLRKENEERRIRESWDKFPDMMGK